MPIAPEYLHMVYPGEVFNALLYGRNSVDPHKKGRSVEDQLTDGRDICHRFEWPIVREFKDTGISASRHARRQRDDFEELLDTIRSGVARIVVAYEASRYYRDLEAYVRIRNACYDAGVLLCYNGQVYDLSKREDRKATAMDAIAAEDEAEGIRDRNLRTARLTAEAGGVWGKLPFGYARKYNENTGDLVGQFEHPTQGPIVLKALQHIDAGGSLHSLVKWLKSETDAARQDGSRWNDHLVKYMLLNRVYLGERLHHGKAVKGTWEPLKGLDTPDGRRLFRRVTKILTDPSRGGQIDSRVEHMLSRLALCGECGDDHLLKATQMGARHQRRLIYRCAENGDTTIREDVLDGYVEEGLLGWLREKEQARAALIPDQEQVAEEVRQAQDLLDVYQEELDEARKLNRTRNEQGRPLLSLASFSQLELELLPKIETLQERLTSVTGVPLLIQDLLSAAEPGDMWFGTADHPAMPMEQRREAIRRIVTVRLFKARKRGVRTIEPGRITLSFVGTPGFRDRLLRARGTAPALRPVPAAGTE
ncbi:recombinase family protein [Streptomyces sp. NPDC060223]|uniref:recombinase family protein n=1 Tax=unclassified Streptomyces TaxID=2593676 RepID=UPI0036366C3C